MDFAIPRLAQARRILRLQGGRLRSNEPTQIFVCAAFGAVIGALTAALHRLVDDALLRRALASEARRRAALLGPARMARQYHAAYSTLVYDAHRKSEEVLCAS